MYLVSYELNTRVFIYNHTYPSPLVQDALGLLLELDASGRALMATSCACSAVFKIYDFGNRWNNAGPLRAP